MKVNLLDLLHAGASYLRIHQKGFGAVGVSTKYGKRAFARYPIFWGMKDVGGLPNPDPTDTADWSGEHVKPEDITVDEELEDSKPSLKRQAQNWAGLVPLEPLDFLSYESLYQLGVDLGQPCSLQYCP